MRYLTKLDVKREAKKRTFCCGTNTRNTESPWDLLSIWYRMLVPIVSMQTFLILLFLWITETVKFALLPNKQMHYINLGELLTSIIR